MAIIIQKVEENLKYIPMNEQGVENPFSVTVKPLDIKTLLMLEDKVVKREDNEISFSMGRYSFDVCKASIINWENINDSEGKPVEFKKASDGVPLDDTIGKLGVEYIQEISNVVTAISRDKSKIQIFFGETKE